MSHTFGHMYIWYRATEPLYEFLIKQIRGDKITFITQLSKFPNISKMPKDKQILCVFDDVVNYLYKEQGIIKLYYILGRKAGKGISMFLDVTVFLSHPENHLPTMGKGRN